jgi:hypothetical protein
MRLMLLDAGKKVAVKAPAPRLTRRTDSDALKPL